MEKIETIHDRVKLLVDTFGNGKNTVFASIIGSNEANVRGYTKNIMPKYDFLEKIARNIEISLDWLLTGRGEMLSTPQDLPHKEAPTNDNAALLSEKDARITELKDMIAAKDELITIMREQLRMKQWQDTPLAVPDADVAVAG